MTFACLASVATSACTVMSGAPDSFVRESLYEAESAPLSVSDDDVAALVAADTAASRNAIMDKIIASIDARYLDFRHSIVANRKHFSASTGVLGTLANVASTLTESPGVKTNYAQLGLVISGVKTQVDSTYLFDQTVFALVSQMDADRAKHYQVMLSLRSSDIEKFPGVAALQQCIAYYHFGTVLSAVSEIGKATAKKAEEEEESKARALVAAAR